MKVLLSLLLFLTFYCSMNAASGGNKCTANLSHDFDGDCSMGLIKNFTRCLHDMDRLSSTIVADELNKQYCTLEDCKFSCTGE